MAKVSKHSADWKVVERLCNEEISRAHTAIETAGMDMTHTEHHRGRIAFARDVLKLAEDAQSIEDAPGGTDDPSGYGHR